jgi:hypothetical protein
MWKSIASLLVVGTIFLMVSQDASAGRRNCRNGGGYYYSGSAAPAATVAAPAAPAPVVAQNSSGGTTYRSYSYDPGLSATTAGRAYTFREPTMPRAMPYMFRADRKMWGLAENPYNY